MLVRRRSILILIVVGVGLLIPVATLATRGGHTRSNSKPANPMPVRYSVSNEPLTRPESFSTPKAILAGILSRYGGSAVTDAYFGGPTPGWTGTEDPSIPLPAEYRDGRWLYSEVSAQSKGAGSMRALWEANLVAGALRDEIHLAGLTGELIASNTSLRLPDGRVIKYAGGGIGRVAFGQSYRNFDSPTIASGIRSAAVGLGLRVQAVSVHRPLQAAPAVVVEATNPAEFVKRANQIYRAIFDGVATYEGQYLEARDSSGDPFFIQATAFRTGVGSRWIRPDLDPQGWAIR